MYIRKPRKHGHSWEFVVKHDGKIFSRSFKDKKAGAVWARELEVNAERGQVGLAQDVTLATAFKTFLTNRAELTASCIKLYASFWKNHIGPAFGSRLLGSIRHADLQSWLGTLTSKGLAPASIQRIVGLFHTISNHAVAGGVIPANPCAGLKLPKKQKVREVRMFSEKEVDEIRAACSTPRLRAAAEVALGTGLRRGELAAFQWTWIDKERGVIRVPASIEAGFIPKGKKDREIPLLPDVETALNAWRPFAPDEGTVFPGANWLRWARIIRANTGKARARAKGIDLAALNKAERRKVIRELSIPFRWHLLRHTFISRLVMAGVSLRTVQAIAGHASIRTTEIYSHLAPDAFDDVRRRFPGGIGAEPKE